MRDYWRESELEKQKEFERYLSVWCKEDQEAIRFILDIVYVSHLWDDLVDGDHSRTDKEINYAFKASIFHFLENRFYARNIGELRPIMINAYLKWNASNKVDDGRKRWFLKASIYDIIVYVTYLIGGMDWAEEQSISVWNYYREEPKDA